jgi:hypothetical protein
MTLQIYGVPLRSLFRIRVSTTRTTSGCVLVRVYDAALFTNWLSLRRHLCAIPSAATGVIVDLSATKLVDQSVRTKLLQLRQDWARQNRALEIIGLPQQEHCSLDLNAETDPVLHRRTA